MNCDYLAHSIHCDEMILGYCNCERKHPANCGHCGAHWFPLSVSTPNHRYHRCARSTGLAKPYPTHRTEKVCFGCGEPTPNAPPKALKFRRYYPINKHG